MIKTAIFAALCCAATASAAESDAGEAWRTPVGRDGVQRVRISCGPDFFDPRVIVVKANIPVELTIRTTQGLSTHSFMLSNPQSATLSAGNAIGTAPKAVAFTPREPGDYPIACQDDSGNSDLSTQKAKQGVLKVIP